MPQSMLGTLWVGDGEPDSVLRNPGCLGRWWVGENFFKIPIWARVPRFPHPVLRYQLHRPEGDSFKMLGLGSSNVNTHQ